MFGSNSFGALAVETPPSGGNAGSEPTEGEEIDVDVSSPSHRDLADSSGSSS